MKALAPILLFLLLSYSGHALIDSASTGTWNNSGTWDSGTSPASGDTLVIPVGVTVTVNCNCGTYSSMHIIVFGTLVFPGGRKINLSANGLVDVYTGGTVTGSNNGDKININGSPVWTGSQTDITGPSSCTSSGCAANPTLPVELIRFSCSLNGDRHLNVEWATASERNNDYFTVYRSSDLVEWLPIFEQSGQGNSIHVIEYTSEVFVPDLNQVEYVRLEQTDFDGSTDQLAMVKVERSLESEATLLNNPDYGRIRIKLDNAVYDSIKLFDLRGVEVSARTTRSGNELLFQDLNAGIYLVQLESKGKVWPIKATVL